MCTVIAKNINGLILGRNMDIECSYGEKFIFTPENYAIKYKNEKIEFQKLQLQTL